MSVNVMEPFNLAEWMNEFKDNLQPPVCVKEIWQDRGLQVFMVGGPNERTDYHRNPREEMFFQVKGDMVLRILEKGRPKDINIREGQMFLLPPMVPHSPQRKADTIGFVQEVRRNKDKLDEMFWICNPCTENGDLQVTYSEKFYNVDNAVSLPVVVNNYYSKEENRTCKKCGWIAPDKKK